MMKFRALILFVLIFSGFPLLAQKNYTFTTQPSDLEERLEMYEEQLSEDQKKLKKSKKEYLQSYYNNRQKGLFNKLQTEELIYNDEIEEYWQKMLQFIADNNPDYDFDDLVILIDQDPTINAASLGNGTFIFNSGLLLNAKSDCELAFILCHEVAHYYLNHFEQRIELHYNFLNNKKKLKEIKRADGNRIEDLDKYLRTATTLSKAYSRGDEREADSLGYVFYLNTGFSADCAIESLELLRTNEEKDCGDTTLHILKALEIDASFSEENWYREIATLPYDFESYVDTTSTHPELDERITTLQKKNVVPTDEITIEPSILEFQEGIHDGMVRSMFNTEHYYYLFYYMLNADHLDEAYRLSTLSKVMSFVYDANKNLKDVNIRHTDEDNCENFNRVIQFFNYASNQELKNINTAFLVTLDDKFPENPYIASAYYEFYSALGLRKVAEKYLKKL